MEIYVISDGIEERVNGEWCKDVVNRWNLPEVELNQLNSELIFDG